MNSNPNSIQIQNHIVNPVQIQNQIQNQNSYSFISNVSQNSPVSQTNLINTNITNIIPNPLNNLREPIETINLAQFKTLNEIGRGTFGEIYKVVWAVNNKVYALKKEILNDMEGVKTRQHRNQTIRSFIASTHCNGIVKIYGNLTIPNGPEFHYYELMELCDRDFEQEI